MRYKVYYKHKSDNQNNLVLFSECEARSIQEARDITAMYLNKNTVIIGVKKICHTKHYSTNTEI